MSSSFAKLSTPKLKELLIDRGRSFVGKRSELLARLDRPVSYEPVQLIFFHIGRSRCGIYFVQNIKQQIEDTLKKHNIRSKRFIYNETRVYFDVYSLVEIVNGLFPEYDSTTWNDYEDDFVNPKLILSE